MALEQSNSVLGATSGSQTEETAAAVQALTMRSAAPLARDAATRDASDEASDDGQEQNDDEDEGEYRLSVNPERPRKISEKKRLDAAAFQSWIEKNQRQISSASNAKAKERERQSVTDLIGDDPKSKIIASPREYQIDLFERAKQKNTIVVLDTGSGKTLISALLLRHVLDQELEDRAVGKRKRVAFFLVDKVALCFQQYAVLNSNLEHPVAKFWGDMSGLLKTKEFWDTQLAENMVIVCTAQIVLDCLNGGFFQISQINLLIFDEAHHTKKNHPYARIIKNHYLRETGDRPRILGMTASPVDAQTRDVRAAAAELESLMCCEIATVSDEVLVRGQARRNQVEVIEYYTSLIDPFDSRTKLWTKISNQVQSLSAEFRPALEFTQEASSTLGTWCADRYWHLLITEQEIVRLIARTQRDFGSGQGDHATDAIRQVQQLVHDHTLSPVSKDSWDYVLSPKTNVLRQVLEDAFCHQGTKRCIVFVEKRYTAVLLADLFQQTDMAVPGMDAAYMVGSQANAASIANMSFREQILALQKFRRGETNCLFATPVAEEGIDIPECDLVIRFDIYNSVIQYIQSKGRARQSNSRYVSMIEEGNMRELRMLKQAGRDATALRQFCSALPADRKVQDTMIDAAAAAKYEESGQKTYEIESTGARLTFSYSLEVLARFVSSLPQSNVSTTADYVVSPVGKKYIADVIFPDTSPIRFVSGYAQRSKMLARCSAAFEACVQLIKKKHINDHLQPMFTKRLPAMRNARLAVSGSKQSDYNMLLRPDIWARLGSGPPTELFVTAIALGNPDAVGHSTSPLLLLTREALPAVSDIPLFFSNGHDSSSKARLVSFETPIKLSRGEVDMLTGFTLRTFDDVFSKEYDVKAEELPYFLAPCTASHNAILAGTDVQVDWKLLEAVEASKYLDWENAPDAFFHDKFVIDPFDGSRKLTLHGLNPNLKPNDPTPADAAMSKCRAYSFVEPTIKEYSNSLWLRARKRSQWKDDQPVVNADVLSLRRNLLDEYCEGESDTSNRCYVILEPLRVSTLPVPFVYMALTLPAILHRLDSSLIVLEACSLLDIQIRPSLALEAMTKDSDNTEEHDKEDINFQAGMGNNYERLEFLGDTFLKMATTISLFTLIPESDEFEYHVERMLLICNQNLYNHATDRKLQEYIRSKAFNRRTWYPNLKLRKGKAPKSEVRHSLADKSIADVCEALIGAAYLSTDEGDMDMAVKAVTKMVKSKNHSMTSFDEYYKAFQIPGWQSEQSSAVQRSAVEKVAKATGYKFRWPPLLRCAFKHPSYPYEPSIPNYQRLEFLGDALLDMAIVDYLFRRFPTADPQWLTEHKMAMASNQFLGCLCVKLKLHKHLLVTTSAVIGNVTTYVTELEEAEAAAQQEAEKNKSAVMRQDFWLQASYPPKALPDIMEAFIGAMFVDSGYDYSVVLRFFNAELLPYFEDMQLYDAFAGKHPVTALTRRIQDDFCCASWRICTSNVPCAVEEGVAAMTESDVVCALLVHEQVVVHATAKSGRYAKISVAKKALDRLRDMDRGTYKMEMGCDCKEATVADAVDAETMEDHATAV